MSNIDFDQRCVTNIGNESVKLLSRAFVIGTHEFLGCLPQPGPDRARPTRSSRVLASQFRLLHSGWVVCCWRRAAACVSGDEQPG